MNAFQRILRAVRSLLGGAFARSETPIPLFRDRIVLPEGTINGTISERSTCVWQVAFVGGPLDGYQDELPLDHLAEVFTIPINSFALAALAGSKVVDQRREPTSIAIYELDDSVDEFACYRFQGAASPEPIHRKIDI